MWWGMYFIPGIRRQRKAGICEFKASRLDRKCQVGQSYRKRPCLKQANKQTKDINFHFFSALFAIPHFSLIENLKSHLLHISFTFRVFTSYKVFSTWILIWYRDTQSKTSLLSISHISFHLHVSKTIRNSTPFKRYLTFKNLKVGSHYI